MSLSNLYVNGLLPMPALLIDPFLVGDVGETMLAGFAPVEQLGDTLEVLERAIGEEAPHFLERFAGSALQIRKMLIGNGTPWEFQEAQGKAAEVLRELNDRRLLVPILEATGWKPNPALRPGLALSDVNALSYLMNLGEFAKRVSTNGERHNTAIMDAARFLRGQMTEAHFSSPNVFYDSRRAPYVYGTSGGYGHHLLLVAPFKIGSTHRGPTIPEDQRIVISDESFYAPNVVSLAGPIAALSGILAFGHPFRSLPMVVDFLAYEEEAGIETESARMFMDTFLGKKKGKVSKAKFDAVIEMNPHPRTRAEDPIVSRRVFAGKGDAKIGVAEEEIWRQALDGAGFSGPLAVGTFKKTGSLTDLLAEHFGPFPHFSLQIADESCEAGTPDENVGVSHFISIIRLLAVYLYLSKRPAKGNHGGRSS